MGPKLSNNVHFSNFAIICSFQDPLTRFCENITTTSTPRYVMSDISTGKMKKTILGHCSEIFPLKSSLIENLSDTILLKNGPYNSLKAPNIDF